MYWTALKQFSITGSKYQDIAINQIRTISLFHRFDGEGEIPKCHAMNKKYWYNFI